MVGLIRQGRNHPRIKERLSAGVALVRGMKCESLQLFADVQRADSGWVFDVPDLTSGVARHPCKQGSGGLLRGE